MGGKRSSGKHYTSQGIVGTVKLGHTDRSILQSMCDSMFDNKGYPRANRKTYNVKQSPQKGNEAKAEARRAKKKAIREAKKKAE